MSRPPRYNSFNHPNNIRRLLFLVDIFLLFLGWRFEGGVGLDLRRRYLDSLCFVIFIQICDLAFLHSEAFSLVKEFLLLCFQSLIYTALLIFLTFGLIMVYVPFNW
jgi:hypothetical protein